MVSVLNRQKTIKALIHRLLLRVSLTTLIFATVTLSFSIYMYEAYSSSTKNMLRLYEMLGSLDEVNSEITDYIWYGQPEEYEGLSQKIENSIKSGKQLQKVSISRNFYRDMMDINALLVKYRENMERIYEKKQSGDKDSELLSQISELQTVYEAVSSQSKELYGQFLEHIQECEIRWNKMVRVSFFLFVLLFLELMYIEIQNANQLSFKILEPLKYLRDGAENINYENLKQIDIPMEMIPEEIGVLKQVINSMVCRIQKQIREIEERNQDREILQQRELENAQITAALRTSQFRALQMQMNPHFLFNTLNMISQTAYMGKNELTVQLLGHTADLLRYSLDNSGKSVTLGREIEAVGDYVTLQEQRFGKRIQFVFRLDESFHETKVPSQILQPLVENALIHGIGNRGTGGKIVIVTRCSADGKNGEIIVEDNGRGMTPEILEQVREQMKKEQMDKVGLSNVFARLNLFFEKNVFMDIISEPEKKTQIMIRIPIENREKRNVECIDCR